jgi:hypothetical protein
MSNKIGTKTTSTAKLKANRRNAQRSTGPKTEPGKQRSANNSYKHGMFSDRLFPSGQQSARDREEYDGLYAGFLDHYSPVGFMEHVLVEKIAMESLRIARLVGYEQVVLGYSAPFETKSMSNMVKYESALTRRLDKAIAALERFQEKRLSEAELNSESEALVGDLVESGLPSDIAEAASESPSKKIIGEPGFIPNCDNILAEFDGPSDAENDGTNPPAYLEPANSVDTCGTNRTGVSPEEHNSFCSTRTPRAPVGDIERTIDAQNAGTNPIALNVVELKHAENSGAEAPC